MNRTQGKSYAGRPEHIQVRWLLVALALSFILLFAAACGGGGDEAANESAVAAEEQDDSGGGLPTMPAARFAAPTTMIDATKVAENEGDATPEPGGELDLAQGEDAYARLCAECHADDGTGVAEKAETIVGVELEQAAFVELLRAGGGYGNEHIFGPTKISDDGIDSLLAYVQTLSE